ncbi:lamin tail domain-containing protein [Polaribacter glomeratus]|uniref:LTD domain-containing protein n=1 Tax=Polaribacter glomeratus TaxID=102 RepID=A0A2S7WU85_9FLAO|nr:lamin tail domain-containing protein [Polaribacter glomeratus]PQJ81160.1 hypothetical protein BTO16_00515 [Polaribacter glomeratus]TXD65714.1 T9SS type A sorting domain-containing protein [Polaribacter glomeratus]
MKKIYFLVLAFALFSSTMSAQLIINEVLFDPASDITGDANGDGTRSPNDDEFIELVNSGSTALDISGYTIEDTYTVTIIRHVVPANTVLTAGGVYLVFGGGTPTASGTAAGNFGTATVIVASSGGLGFSNSSEVIIVRDASGTAIATLDASTLSVSTGADASVTRSPDIAGDFILHPTVNGVAFSPGLKIDGSTVLNIKEDLFAVFAMYPNPVINGKLTIISAFNGSKKVELFDTSGRSVLQTNLTTNVLNIETVKSGIYFLKVSQGSNISTSKLLIK